MAHFHSMLATSLIFGMAAAAFLGWFIARRGLAPVRDMATVARNISASRLRERLPVETVPKELRDLATAFNDMLGRLESSFSRLSNFSSDLAHELRTPINNLMIQSQVVLSQVRDAEEYRETLASSLEEYDRLARMIADMLFLAKADNGLVMPQREHVDLAAEIERLSEFFGPLAEEGGVGIRVEGSGSVSGDRIMLQRAIANVLSNAIKHTPPGGEIRVQIGDGEPSFKRIAVENPGATIPAEELERIFDRFYRIDPARGKAPDGVGLGLAITKSIAEAHGGCIDVSSAEGLTTFSISLPMA